MRIPGMLIAAFAALCWTGFSGWNQAADVAPPQPYQCNCPQAEVGTLPLPYSCNDDVQYFAPGPEFKLAREAAAMQAAAAELQ